MALERTIAYLLLGGNLGDIKANLHLAIQLLEERVGKIVSVSALYETAAWGKTDQPAFLNQAVGVETDLAPMDVLAAALAIEAELGRIRKEKWGERLIDIDLILFGDQVINIEGKLQVPHPHMQDRNFVLTPLAEIAGDVVHPVWNKNISTLAENTSDKLPVKRL
ncbi:2-amino-4-hydroxy-6-hydroxymethyldihydropteridine diphosphokinase [Pedobacter rhizosphaerae]|uniref:2-amino-4-hydroxy-6-hydroxymethyldihydropteridine pyrophosphokinase n=1 Tax=Pedobacter rhizosphaerae TaxID=390241 RepID=A0A1H9SRS3_9SPHI|nr:2-amino-4-hydroxy-6-hydroxymethyldihydropteridine diphosphokinase [Pedobacter rhizosphaerae]SER87621.1 2-amino-4-hydroxy-6-hydroxymethyldihydropteridinediphosphokinase [Pedobacter rhizosphaerae]